MPPADAESLTSQSLTTRNGVASPTPSVSLSRNHITEALLRSPDNGETLDLAHKNLTDVGEDGSEELSNIGRYTDAGSESTVVRIALAHNRLTTLPMAFSLLSRLRYLVLKSNNFTVFPDVLTVMSSLEILDISRNKIKRLPSQPGSLTNLRVFSILRNKIHRLPPYFAQFRNLTLFKADQNPLEWPPKTVMGTPSNIDDSEVMKVWIQTIQIWIENNTPSEMERKMSDDSTQLEQSSIDLDADRSMEDSLGNSSYLNESQSTGIPSQHSRSFSLESDISIYSDMASLHSKLEPVPTKPTRLRLDVLPTTRIGSTVSPLRSPGTYLPTPDESISSAEDDVASTSRARADRLSIHNRNASSGIPPPSRHRMFSKKSMPDFTSTSLFENQAEAGPSNHGTHSSSLPSPPHRQESDSSNGSLASLHRTKVLAQDVVSTSPISIDRPAPPMDVERNSYFRRLSTLTSAVLSKTIPESLLTLVDAIRGILFAVSQIYQTLQHYTVYAIDERLSAVLLKVLDPASVYMNQLIAALDRFDTMSRRTLPSPAVCRAVVESCRDNVTVFGKAVGVLSLQLKVLATHDDVRYTRQMLLILYGAMAEIASAWQSIAGQIEAVKPLLQEHRPPPVAKLYNQQTPTIRTTAASVVDIPQPAPVSAPPVSSASFLPTNAQPRTLLRSNSGNGQGDGKTRRRHAGSFSWQDVETGKMLPSYVGMPHLSAGLVETSATPTLRATRRPGTSSASNYASPSSSALPVRWDSHSRQSSQGSLLASTSSPSLGGKGPSLDLTSNTNTLVDKEAIEAMRVAVDAAPGIWEMMDEVIVDAQESKGELREGLDKAKEVTDRLKESIQSLESRDTSADRRNIRDDAHTFAKTVIHLSNTIKTHGTTHSLSPTLRTNMVKLTNATQEFVMLLHVSSFSPGIARPYSPMVGASTPQMMSASVLEDGRLGANLSRSRSVAPSASSKLTRPLREPPRSALPHQSFKIPMPPRFGLLRSRSGEESAAVPG